MENENTANHPSSKPPAAAGRRQSKSSSSETASFDHRHSQTSLSPPAASPDHFSPAKSSVSSEVSDLSHGLSFQAQASPASHPPQSASPAAIRYVRDEPVANRYVRDEPAALVKVADQGPRTGVVDGVGGGKRPRSGLSRRSVSDSVRRAALGFRLLEVVLCLISLSVMAADKNKGWAVDSFYRYKEFRYCMGVNIVGFVYSAIQGCDLAYQLASGNYYGGLQYHLRCYFDFAFDQMLAYLLISASSSAATRVDDWQLNWGKDKFPDMASASVGISFVAFVAFALSALISGYSLCNMKSS